MISLKEKYKDYFHIGASVSNQVIHTHSKLLKEHFNSITCENEMKYSSVCNEEGEYDFTKADEIAAFAKENNMFLRGHTLVWHNQTPKWIFENADKEILLKRLENHITKIGNRYKDSVYCWDVVNEAIEDKTEIILRESPWPQILGEDFMEQVFTLTKEILPEKKLFYNDYNETDPNKSIKIYNAIKSMKEKGVPIEGLGMQLHGSIHYPSLDELKKALELYASLQISIHITELDISVYDFNDKSGFVAPSKEILEKQAQVYGDFFKVFRDYKDVIESVTTWGVADDYTWLDNFPVRNRKNWPLLFDENHQPKEALLRILDF